VLLLLASDELTKKLNFHCRCSRSLFLFFFIARCCCCVEMKNLFLSLFNSLFAMKFGQLIETFLFSFSLAVSRASVSVRTLLCLFITTITTIIIKIIEESIRGTKQRLQ
jgi:hypothetical protein